nr:uncharacterized protein LOC131793140 [Pocillopora verrucosa]
MADDNYHTVASSNMNQPTSSESSAIFMDQSNMYPLNDSPMLDYTALWDIMMPQESATNETNDATISSAPGRKFVVYQEVIFVSEKHSLVLYTSMKLTIFFPISFFFIWWLCQP